MLTEPCEPYRKISVNATRNDGNATYSSRKRVTSDAPGNGRKNSSAASSTPTIDAVPALANSTHSVVPSTSRTSWLAKKARYAASVGP